LSAQPADLAMKSRHAKELMAAGKYEQAIGIYRDLAHALPNNPGLIMDLGLALHMSGHEEEAIREFEAVLKLSPRQVPSQLYLGYAYLNLGKLAKAIAPLENVIQAEPENRDARVTLAEALLSLERFDQAAAHFQRLTELEPENPKGWSGLGLCYEALAQRNFKELGKVAPSPAYWLALVAESRLKNQQYSSAFFFYRQALAKTPTLRGAHAALAQIYKNTGHSEWAAVEEEKERKMPPPDCSSVAALDERRNPTAVTDRRYSAEKLECDFLAGRYREVVALARRARTAESYYWQSRAYNHMALEAFSHLTRLPPSAELHELIARIQFNQKRYLESVKEWREALKLSPGNPEIQKHLAIALNLSGDYQTARELLGALLKRQPNSAELNYLLAETLLFMQQAEEAVPLLKKSVELDPKLLAAHGSLANAYLQLGQATRAIPHLKAALGTDEDGSLHYQLARAYQSSGQQEQAKEMLEKYREIRNALAAERKATEEEVQITPP
jgi:tetratricopeptide (TPR) repeat protein